MIRLKYSVRKNSDEYHLETEAKLFVESRLAANNNELLIETEKYTGKYGRYIGTTILADNEKTRKAMDELVLSGRLPITAKNIRLLVQEQDVSSKAIINEYSGNVGITMIGIREELVKKEKEKLFEGYDELGTILFVHSKNQKSME